MVESIKYRWVIRQYEAGDERGKRALANAKAGMMYYLINKNRLPSDYVLVAFKYPDFKPLLDGMVYASEEQAERLENKTNPLINKRSGAIM